MSPPDVRAIWDAVASGWSRHEDTLVRHLAPVTESLLAAMEPRPGHAVLELAAGTGHLSRAIAAAVAPDGSVLCTDLAPRMVEAARQRVSDAGLPNVRCAVMDAHDIDLPTGSVDAIACSFGFMLMPDLPLALDECYRVLRPGGRLVLSTWGLPEHNPWLLAVAGALLQHGHVAQSDPTGPGGVFSLASPETVVETVGRAGFTDTTVEPVDLTQRFDTFGDYWQFHADTGGPVAAALRSLEPDEVGRVAATCEEACRPFITDHGRLALPGRALVARTRRVGRRDQLVESPA